jgi:hypothetical protein
VDNPVLNGGPMAQIRRASRRRAEAKGRRLQAIVKAALEAEGAMTETAKKVLVWRRRGAQEGHSGPGDGARPFSVSHDFWNCFDLICAFPDGRRCCVQVTTLANVASHRLKILRSGFPATADDAILAHEKGRSFRELRGPLFQMPGRYLVLPPLPRRLPKKVLPSASA